MIVYVDIDGTICSQEQDYAEAKPFLDKINQVNKLYDEGHRIIYWTARGTMTGINWRPVTEEQFRKWGVKHHAIEFGKPAYDLLIDDKSRNEVA